MKQSPLASALVLGAASGDFEIGQDGTVLLRLLGLVSVTGRPFAEVTDDLLRAYQRELVNPAVTSTPLVRIRVLGEVQRPGLLPVDPTLNLADVVAAAGQLLTAVRLQVSSGTLRSGSRPRATAGARAFHQAGTRRRSRAGGCGDASWPHHRLLDQFGQIG